MPTDIDFKTNKVFLIGEDGNRKELGVVANISITPAYDNFIEVDADYNVKRENVESGEFIFDTDICVRRLLSTIIDERLGSNNWRKLHGLPMWRLR